LQVVSVAAVDVTAAVAFQAGELLLAGVVQIADASAQELAQSGDPAAALAAGVSETRHVVATASAPVVSAVTTAVANIRNSLHDPFPAAVKTDQPKKPDFPTTTRSAHPALELVAVVSGIPMWRPQRARPLTLSRTSSIRPRTSTGIAGGTTTATTIAVRRQASPARSRASETNL
jgi:hypothetical protein